MERKTIPKVVRQIKAEAIKEFAERLKKRIYVIHVSESKHYIRMIKKAIDMVAEEMERDNK